MLYVQKHYPKEKYEQAFVSLWLAMWQEHIDISKPDLLAKVLSPNFSEEEIKNIIAAAGQQEYKDLLSSNTKKAIELGAFGAPFFSVTDSEGKNPEPFFGSDRQVTNLLDDSNVARYMADSVCLGSITCLITWEFQSSI